MTRTPGEEDKQETRKK